MTIPRIKVLFNELYQQLTSNTVSLERVRKLERDLLFTFSMPQYSRGMESNTTTSRKTVYNVYGDMIRESLKTSHPDKTGSEIAAMIAERYRQDKAAKAPLFTEAKAKVPATKATKTVYNIYCDTVKPTLRLANPALSKMELYRLLNQTYNTAKSTRSSEYLSAKAEADKLKSDSETVPESTTESEPVHETEVESHSVPVEETKVEESEPVHETEVESRSVPVEEAKVEEPEYVFVAPEPVPEVQTDYPQVTQRGKIKYECYRDYMHQKLSSIPDFEERDRLIRTFWRNINRKLDPDMRKVRHVIKQRVKREADHIWAKVYGKVPKDKEKPTTLRWRDNLEEVRVFASVPAESNCVAFQ